MFPRLLTFNSEVWKLNWSSPQWSDPIGAIEKQRRRSIQDWSHKQMLFTRFTPMFLAF